MTISTELRKAGPFTGNGVTTAFPFSFKVFAATDVTATRADTLGAETGLVLNTDFTVALNADQDAAPGGTVTLAAPLSTGYRLVVSSAVPNLQPTDITNNGGFYPRVIEDALDRHVAQVQQIDEKVGRALKVAITSPLGDQALPSPVAGMLIGWNESSDGLKNYAPIGGTLLGQQLAAADGSSLVGFRQAGAGAVARTSQDKLRETVSVKDFGALGDGITNDTTAIQAAIDSGAGTVLFPAGNYVISGISITSSIALVGDVVSGSEYLTRLLCATNGILVERAAGADNIVNVQLENLRIEKTGAAKAAGTYGIKFVAANAGVSVRNVEIRFFEKNLWLRGVIGAQFSNIASRGGAYGLFTESHNIAPFNYDTTNCDYYGCKFTDSNDVGVYLGAITQGQNFFGGDIERNLVGVEFANTAPASSVINFFGTWFEENTTVHWKFTQKPNPVVFQGCYIYGSTLFDNPGAGVITATVRECRLLAGVAVDKDIFRGSWVNNSVEGTVTFNATDPNGYYCQELTNVNISVGGISIYRVENLGSGRYFVAANAAPVTTGLNQGSEWLNITTGKRYLYVGSQWNEVMSAIVHTRTLDPTSIPSGSTGTTGPFTVTGAALGDMVLVGAPYDLQGIIATAYVNAANSVTVRMYNPTGGAIDLASGTWQVRVVKQ